MPSRRRDPGSKELGAMIQQLRIDLRLKRVRPATEPMRQDELAAVLGHKGTDVISKIENGHYRPTWPEYQVLRDHLCRNLRERKELDRLMLGNTDRERVFHPFNLSPGLIAFVHDVYGPMVQNAGGELVERVYNNHTYKYPAAFFPARGQSIETLLPIGNMDACRESAISTQDHEKYLAIREPAYRIIQNEQLDYLQQRTEFGQTNGWNVCMTRLHTAKGRHPVTEGRLCEYGPVLDSGDCLRDELIWTSIEKFSQGITDADYEAMWEALPLRREIHEREGNPLTSAQHRAAAFGISGAIVFRRREDDQHCILTGKRSGEVATYQHAVSVVPSGMSNWRFTGNPRDSANPDGTAAKPFGTYREDYFRLTLLDEYAEEAGGGVQLSDIKGDPDDVLNAPFVQKLLHTHQAKIQYTGLALDLLTLRPEVCFVMVIDDVEWLGATRYERNIVLTPDEYDRRGGLMSDPITDLEACLTRVNPEWTMPPSAAAALYGIDAAKELLGI